MSEDANKHSIPKFINARQKLKKIPAQKEKGTNHNAKNVHNTYFLLYFIWSSSQALMPTSVKSCLSLELIFLQKQDELVDRLKGLGKQRWSESQGSFSYSIHNKKDNFLIK